MDFHQKNNKIGQTFLLSKVEMNIILMDFMRNIQFRFHFCKVWGLWMAFQVIQKVFRFSCI